MKQTQFDKHTIAWFKIADYVSRGEKERALGVYRLLSHSFNDNAIARQLEADIYCSFGETEQAIVLYQQAMDNYYKSERFFEAAAVGEHLIVLCSDDINLRRTLVQLYISLCMVGKIKSHIVALVNFIAKKQQWYDVKTVIAECSRMSQVNERIIIYAQVIISMYQINYPRDVLADSIRQLLNDSCFIDDKISQQEFLELLLACSNELYEYVVVYIEK